MVANALSHKYALLSTLETKFLGFEFIKELYEHDANFSNKYVLMLHLMGILGMMGICEGARDFECLRVQLWTYLLERHMEGA